MTESDYIGDPGVCDVCGRPLDDEMFFCDAELTAHGGRWGVLCKVCTDVEGTRQLDGLADIGTELSKALGCQVSDLWIMQNGYALATKNGLEAITAYLREITEKTTRELEGLLRIGIHQGVEVTDGPSSPGPLVTQVFCSALPVAYGRWPQPLWREFAQVVLNAAYEATLLAGVMNSRQGGSSIVLLTMLGGGAFGNAPDWIYTAIRRALKKTQGYHMDVRLVSYGRPPDQLLSLVQDL